MWMPKTYQDYLEAIPEDFEETSPPTYIRLPMFKGKYQCTKCGIFVKSFRLTDCTNLPIDYDWACDGCWNSWRRNGIVIDGGPPITDRAEWLERWVAAHDAPQEVKDHVAAKSRYPIIKSKLKGKKVVL